MQFANRETNFTTMEGKCIEKAEGLTVNKFYRLQTLEKGMVQVYNDKRDIGIYPEKLFKISNEKQIYYAKAN